jgi:molybdopterin converting factor subunit 1
MMTVKVRLFATLRERAGWAQKSLELPMAATVETLLAELAASDAALDVVGRPVYAAVNQQYAQRETVLQDGDEVALFPPVSGGESGQTANAAEQETGNKMIKYFELTEQPISVDEVAARVTTPDCGAVVTFSGTVRGETRLENATRATDFLVYEAYVEMAEAMLAELGEELRKQWPKVRAVSIVHRLGRCEVGEPTVVIAVASPHRGDGCFEACAWAIERLKEIAPIWKQENWADGQVWVEGPRQSGLDVSTNDNII